MEQGQLRIEQTDEICTNRGISLQYTSCRAAVRCRNDVLQFHDAKKQIIYFYSFSQLFLRNVMPKRRATIQLCQKKPNNMFLFI